MAPTPRDFTLPPKGQAPLVLPGDGRDSTHFPQRLASCLDGPLNPRHGLGASQSGQAPAPSWSPGPAVGAPPLAPWPFCKHAA